MYVKRTYLNRITDLSFQPGTVSKLYNKHYSDGNSNVYQAVYIHEMFDGKHGTTQCVPANKKVRTQFGRDSHRIARTVTILQGKSRSMALLPFLCWRPHGSCPAIQMDEVYARMDKLCIPNVTLSPDTANRGNVAIDEEMNIIVSFPNSTIMNELDSAFGGGRPRYSFECGLAKHMYSNVSTTDPNRVSPSGVAAHNDVGSDVINNRIEGMGYGQKQRVGNLAQWFCSGHNMPTINIRDFIRMPDSVKKGLMKLLEVTTAHVKKCYR